MASLTSLMTLETPGIIFDTPERIEFFMFMLDLKVRCKFCLFFEQLNLMLYSEGYSSFIQDFLVFSLWIRKDNNTLVLF